jgi:hypothetical protein
MHIMVLGLGLVLIVMHHEIMLALAFNGYMIYGMLNELRYQVFPSHRPAEWDVAAAAASSAAVPGGGTGTEAGATAPGTPDKTDAAAAPKDSPPA